MGNNIFCTAHIYIGLSHGNIEQLLFVAGMDKLFLQTTVYVRLLLSSPINESEQLVEILLFHMVGAGKHHAEKVRHSLTPHEPDECTP